MNRIEPRLVPRPLWKRNLRGVLSRRAWDTIRARVVDRDEGTCVACGASRPKGMVCDEVWEYDEPGGSATIVGLRLLCPDCNAVTHIGNVRARRGHETERLVIQHMAEVNGTTSEEAQEQVGKAFVLWRRQSAIPHWEAVISRELKMQFPEFEQVGSL